MNVVFKEGTIECVEKPLDSSNFILKNKTKINFITPEKRLQYWSYIVSYYLGYMKQEYGKFLSDLHSHFLSKFDLSSHPIRFIYTKRRIFRIVQS